MKKALKAIISWLIILIPFAMAISPAPVNVFMGMLIFFFLVKRIAAKENIFPSTPINLPLYLFFFVTCISLFNSVDLKDSWRGGVLRLLQYVFVFFAVAAEAKDKALIKKVCFSVFFGVMLASIDAIWQVITGHDFIRGYEPILNIGLLRATAAFKESNMLGIYLSALAPLLFGITFYFFTRGKKAFFGVISLLVLIATALTFSRPTLLAVYVVFLFFTWVKKQKIIFASLILLILISPFIAPKQVKNWAKEVNYNPLRFMCNDDRIAVYRNSFHMIKAHPIIGVGANAFMKSYKKYKEFPEYRNVVTLDEMKAHNLYLHLAGEVGLVGLGIFFWLLYKLFAFARKAYKKTTDHFLKTIILSLFACLIAFLVNGLTESSLSYSRVAILFWYLSGLLCAAASLSNADRSKQS
ncbi:MAG: O-antigen ligase family protein [Candidatus Omnitrophica bacterium]|nr:O-antigen ligase family protein [Candidatus Omnitrophota bacterium]MDD5652652.1 O-antigen ligase family protein [Candidatus Omnitrophota bacterium]